MIRIIYPGKEIWPLWQKILFRFFFIYLLLFIEPWTWIAFIPGGDYITRYYYQFLDWAVDLANKYVFHIREHLVPMNGSGDTSYGWAMVSLFACLSLLGCLAWSLIRFNKKNYNALAYWLRLVTRYFLIINCFSYGLDKIFVHQMPFPSLSQLATPLGDYLPMRLSWMFMGYSTHYQVFSGIMELFAGFLLIYRRTSLLGTLISLGIFINVMMLNLSYDIPVKIYAINLVIDCLVLLAFDYKRLFAFFIQNATPPPQDIYKARFPYIWLRNSLQVFKWIFVVGTFIFYTNMELKIERDLLKMTELHPIREGVYNVTRYVLNRDTIPLSYNNPMRWTDIIFERGGSGSINTEDTMFRQRYRRGYFNYAVDTTRKTIEFTKRLVTGEQPFLFKLNYEIPDSNTIILTGLVRKDSLYAMLKKYDRPFQLTERQFHWLSEYNR